MSTWFRRWDRKSTAETAEEAPESSVQKSLALNTLFHQIKEGQKYTILDLGPPVGGNVEFFSQYSCKLYIEDLFETITSFDFLSPEDGFSYDKVFSYLLPYQKSCRFDFILAWDVLNYLDREAFRSLMIHLGRFSRKGTLMFSLISTNRHMPEVPHRFKILDNENLSYVSQSSVLRDCPRYESTELAHMMPGFRVANSFFLRNGYREYLFLYE
ncbi:MAG: hypothetical protein P8020_12560 [Acidobacteriota bacterium]|jgi:hypothetical protein